MDQVVGAVRVAEILGLLLHLKCVLDVVNADHGERVVFVHVRQRQVRFVWRHRHAN